MSITKRILSATVCAVLLITGGIIGAEANTDCAGAGNGTNAKVEKLETFQEVIDSLNARQKSEKVYSPVRDGNEGTKYTSSTVIEIANAYSTMETTSSSSEGSTTASSRTDFTRTLSMYFGEKASYYESDLQLASSSSSSFRPSYSAPSSVASTKKVTKSTLDIHMYLYAAEGCVMLYLARLNYSYYSEYENSKKPEENYKRTEKDTIHGKTLGVLREYSNRWIDCTDTPEIAKQFLEVDSVNLKGLSAFSDLIEEQINSEENDLKKNGNVYTLKESALLKFFGLSAYKEEADISGGLKVDLSAKTEPEISYWLSSKINDRYGYLSAVEQFKNINNTVVNKPSGKTVDVKEINDRIEELGDD